MIAYDLFPLGLTMPVIFSIPSTSFTLDVSPTGSGITYYSFSPPISCAHAACSSRLSTFLDTLVVVLQLSRITGRGSLPGMPLYFII